MGYTTDFTGTLQLSRKLKNKERKYINRISGTRRMKRDVSKLMELYEGKHGNPFATEKTPEAIYGNDGEYFAMKDDQMGQTQDASIVDYNTPPGQGGFMENEDFDTKWNETQRRIKAGECQPGLWCQWIINKENELVWDGGEKFYEYTGWLQYYITNFFSKWGVMINGEIEWNGEDPDDFGKIVVKDNVIEEKVGRKVYD